MTIILSMVLLLTVGIAVLTLGFAIMDGPPDGGWKYGLLALAYGAMLIAATLRLTLGATGHIRYELRDHGDGSRRWEMVWVEK